MNPFDDKYAVWFGIAVVIACLVCFILTIISFNCAADKKWQCAQGTGITASVSSCCALILGAAAYYVLKD